MILKIRELLTGGFDELLLLPSVSIKILGKQQNAFALRNRKRVLWNQFIYMHNTSINAKISHTNRANTLRKQTFLADERKIETIWHNSYEYASNPSTRPAYVYFLYGFFSRVEYAFLDCFWQHTLSLGSLLSTHPIRCERFDIDFDCIT